jgi:acetylserotonin N-methyltransferase
MNLYQSPTADDRILWDLHLSGFPQAAVLAADELGVFKSLADAPADITTFAARTGLSERAVRALLPMLAAMGFLVTRGGVYSITHSARDFLLPGSPYYWGPVLEYLRRLPPPHTELVKTLKGTDKIEDTPLNAWETGEMPEPVARMVTAYMHSHSLAAAVAMARAPVLRGVRRLLDVGGGSGCYSIALAQADARIHCVILELSAVCNAAKDYIAAGGVTDRVTTVAANMFRDAWPEGYDGLLFSNIFHDWDYSTCRTLAARAFQALEPGGRIFLHEALLDDTRDGPLTTAAFSIQMLIGTRGQQFTLADLAGILQGAGFVDVQHASTHAYFSVVSATRPR